MRDSPPACQLYAVPPRSLVCYVSWWRVDFTHVDGLIGFSTFHLRIESNLGDCTIGRSSKLRRFINPPPDPFSDLKIISPT